MLFCVGILTSSGVTQVWLGATDETTEGSWVWNNGAPGNLF